MGAWLAPWRARSQDNNPQDNNPQDSDPQDSNPQDNNRFVNPLKIPALLTGEEMDGESLRKYDLRMAKGTSQFFADKATPTLGFNGAYLGPTLLPIARSRPVNGRSSYNRVQKIVGWFVSWTVG